MLRQRRVYSTLLITLSFLGALFSLSYSDLEVSDIEATQRAALVFIVGTVVLLLSFLTLEVLLHRILRRSSERWALCFQHNIRQHMLYSGCYLIIGALLYLIFRPDYSSDWEKLRGDNANILLIIAPFFMFLGFPSVVSALQTNRLLFVVALFMLLLVFMLSGSRAGALTALAFYAWSWLSFSRDRLLSFKMITRLILLGLTTLLIHATLRGLRSFSPEELLSIITSADFNSLISALLLATGDAGLAGSESTIPGYLVFAVRSAYENDYGFITSITRTLTLFLPSAIFPDKPIDVTYVLWSEAFSNGLFDDSPYYYLLYKDYIGGIMGSLHPTLFGELFLSGQWFGLCLGVTFFAGVCVIIDIFLLRLRPVSALLLVGPSIIGMAMIARGNSVIGVGYFVYLLPIVWLTTEAAKIISSSAHRVRIKS